MKPAMVVDIKTARKYAESYRKILRQAKRAGISFTDAPEAVQEAALALHQNALMVHEHDRKVRRAAEAREREEGRR